MENDKVLIAIEWSNYLNLYKYNNCFISEYNIMECALDKAQNILFDRLNVNALERALPFFERDMDAVILEYNKRKLKFDHGIYISFEGVLNIIPLSREAYEMIYTRIPTEITLSNPLPASIISSVLYIRRKKYRREAIDALINHYNIKLPDGGDKFIDLIHKAVEKVLNLNSQVNKSSILYNLLTFDITPSFIPEGNIESIIKIGCIVYKANESEIENITGGDFYNVCINSKNKINAGSILNGFKAFNNNYQVLSSNAKGSINKLLDELKKELPEINPFLVYYIYLSLNRIVSKNEFNLELVDNDLRELKQNNENELFYALVLFGSVHSIDRLYESIHKLNKAPLFSNDRTKNENKPYLKADLTYKKSKEEKIDNKDNTIKNDPIQSELSLDFDSDNAIEDIEINDNTDYSKLSRLISDIESKIDFKSVKDKNYWEIAKERIRELKEVNLGSLEGVFNHDPFITKTTKKKNAYAKRIIEAVIEVYES